MTDYRLTMAIPVILMLGVGDAVATNHLDMPTVAASARLAGDATVQAAGSESFRQILANAPLSARARFSFGKIQFNTEWDPAPGQVPANDGLGPTFNAIACASCHINNGRGLPPELPDQAFEALLVRLSQPGIDSHGGPKPLVNYGDQLQHKAVEGAEPEGAAILSYEYIQGKFPDGTPYELRRPVLSFPKLNFGEFPPDVLTSLRLANPLPGLGLLEAVPDSALQALADPNDLNSDGISGRTNRVWSSAQNAEVTGRFGWKANVASIPEQNAGAALGDMGITTELRAINNCPAAQIKCSQAAAKHPDEPEFQQDFFEQLTRYVRMLAVPAQRNANHPAVQLGAQLFSDIGCDGCHVANLTTGEAALYPELVNQSIHPYTDLLLHDMGDGLADGRPDYLASGSEWRTAPLWGIGLTRTVSGAEFYLHDGRARTLTEAILWHGGEAQPARDSFASLPGKSRDALLEFLKSL